MKRSLAREFKTVEIALKYYRASGDQLFGNEALKALNLIKQESEELRAIVGKISKVK